MVLSIKPSPWGRGTTQGFPEASKVELWGFAMAVNEVPQSLPLEGKAKKRTKIANT